MVGKNWVAVALFVVGGVFSLLGALQAEPGGLDDPHFDAFLGAALAFFGLAVLAAPGGTPGS